MTDYSDVIRAQLTGETVRMATLARFDFASGAMRLWSGFGELEAAAGGGQVERWLGLGELVSVGGVAQSGDGLAAEEVEFSISGTDSALVANFIGGDDAETSGRTVTLYEAFFDDDWQLLADPRQDWRGTMGPATIRLEPPSADEPPRRTIRVRAINRFADRHRSRVTYFADSDQRARSSDDAMFSRVGTYAGGGVKARWPVL